MHQPTIDDLVKAARRATKHAYAPYSRYPVGAAVLAGSGRVYTGCNIENAVYGLTVCAERVAVWTAVANGEREITAVAVATPNGATPCGACRQVLAEFAPASAPVAVAGASEYQTLTVGDLLPFAFLPHDLGDARTKPHRSNEHEDTPHGL